MIYERIYNIYAYSGCDDLGNDVCVAAFFACWGIMKLVFRILIIITAALILILMMDIL